MNLNDELCRLLDIIPHVDLENRLMAISDREIAISMKFMDDQHISKILTCISKKKAMRIRSELHLQDRLNIHYNQYKIAASHVIDKIQSVRNKSSLRSYIRPRRYKDR